MGELKKKIGCVKWFNNKSGYGFITVLGENNDYSGLDRAPRERGRMGSSLTAGFLRVLAVLRRMGEYDTIGQRIARE